MLRLQLPIQTMNAKMILKNPAVTGSLLSIEVAVNVAQGAQARESG